MVEQAMIGWAMIDGTMMGLFEAPLAAIVELWHLRIVQPYSMRTLSFCVQVEEEVEVRVEFGKTSYESGVLIVRRVGPIGRGIKKGWIIVLQRPTVDPCRVCILKPAQTLRHTLNSHSGLAARGVATDTEIIYG